METTKVKLAYYKQIVLDKIKQENDNPSNRLVRQWIGKNVNVPIFLGHMQKEGLIDINFVKEGATVFRYLKPLVDKIDT